MIFISEENDIFFNLAFENILINRYPEDEKILYLWQNDRSVIIGRYQNPWEECSIENIKADKIKLARRKSGGGAVFHDMGNVCFTIIGPRNTFSKEENYSLLVKVLNDLGVHAQISGRNDILADGKKVSGSAFEFTKTRACHHGTMLLNSDLSNIERYLTPNRHKLESHGVKSVSSRVCNLGISAEEFIKKMIEEFDSSAKAERVNKKLLDSDGELKKQFDFFRSDLWCYGNTPKFTNRFETEIDGELFSILLNVEKGVVKEATIYTDSLDTDKVEAVKNKLIGSEYQKLSLEDSSS